LVHFSANTDNVVYKVGLLHILTQISHERSLYTLLIIPDAWPQWVSGSLFLFKTKQKASLYFTNWRHISGIINKVYTPRALFVKKERALIRIKSSSIKVFENPASQTCYHPIIPRDSSSWAFQSISGTPPFLESGVYL